MADYTNKQDSYQALNPLRRNNYFFGKMMDLRNFEMEQSYFMERHRLISRLTLGEGVLCGLGVERTGDKLCIYPGVAIDGLGREIIVPEAVSIDPWTLIDDCGETVEELPRDQTHVVHLCLIYNESLSDFAPVLVPTECKTEDRCAAGTVNEGFRFIVRKGWSPAPGWGMDQGCCDSLFPDSLSGNADEKYSQRRALLNACLSGQRCLSAVENPCMVLADVQLKDDGTLGGLFSRHQKRVYSNQVLMELILCLAERLDECCKDTEPGPVPGELAKVTSVEIIDRDQNVLGTLTDPSERLQISVSNNQVAMGIRVTFSKAMDHSTITAFGPDVERNAASFEVTFPVKLVPRPGEAPVSGAIEVIDERTILWMTGGLQTQDEYKVKLFGDVDPAGLRPAIQSADGSRLDGEPLSLPSGDDSEGGNFTFSFRIRETLPPRRRKEKS